MISNDCNSQYLWVSLWIQFVGSECASTLTFVICLCEWPAPVWVTKWRTHRCNVMKKFFFFFFRNSCKTSIKAVVHSLLINPCQWNVFPFWVILILPLFINYCGYTSNSFYSKQFSGWSCSLFLDWLLWLKWASSGIIFSALQQNEWILFGFLVNGFVGYLT